MEELFYETPNGNVLSESELRNQYGERFDSLVEEGLLKLAQEEQSEVKKKEPTTRTLPEPSPQGGITMASYSEDGSLASQESEIDPRTLEVSLSPFAKEEKVRNMRTIARDNTRLADYESSQEDKSTVLLSYMSTGNTFSVFPTLFPIDPFNYSEDPDTWMELEGNEAFEMAKQRGEVIEFENEKEAAEFAKGSWKDSYEPFSMPGMQVSGGMTAPSNYVSKEESEALKKKREEEEAEKRAIENIGKQEAERKSKIFLYNERKAIEGQIKGELDEVKSKKERLSSYVIDMEADVKRAEEKFAPYYDAEKNSYNFEGNQEAYNDFLSFQKELILKNGTYKKYLDEYEDEVQKAENLYRRYAINFEALAEKGSIGEAFMTGLVAEGIPSMLGGIAKFAVDVSPYLNVTNPGGLAYLSLPEEVRGAQGREYTEQIQGKQDALEEVLYKWSLKTGVGATREFLSEDQGLWVQAMQGLGASVPAMLLAGVTYGGSFFGQAYDGMGEMLDDNKAFTHDEKVALKVGAGAVIMAFERFGFSTIVKNKAIRETAVGRVLSKIIKQQGKLKRTILPQEFLDIVLDEGKAANAVMNSFKQKAYDVASRTATGTLAEAETGALQELFTGEGLKYGINEIRKAQGKEAAFDEVTAGQMLTSVGLSGLLEGMGGAVMSGAFSLIQKRKGATKDDFRKALPAIEMLDANAVEGVLRAEVEKKNISKEEGRELFDAFKEYKEDLSKIPSDLSVDDKIEAVELIKQRRGLQQKLEKADPAFQGRIQEEINKVNEKLSEIGQRQPAPSEEGGDIGGRKINREGEEDEDTEKRRQTKRKPGVAIREEEETEEETEEEKIKREAAELEAFAEEEGLLEPKEEKPAEEIEEGEEERITQEFNNAYEKGKEAVREAEEAVRDAEEYSESTDKELEELEEEVNNIASAREEALEELEKAESLPFWERRKKIKEVDDVIDDLTNREKEVEKKQREIGEGIKKRLERVNEASNAVEEANKKIDELRRKKAAAAPKETKTKEAAPEEKPLPTAEEVFAEETEEIERKAAEKAAQEKTTPAPETKEAAPVAEEAAPETKEKPKGKKKGVTSDTKGQKTSVKERQEQKDAETVASAKTKYEIEDGVEPKITEKDGKVEYEYEKKDGSKTVVTFKKNKNGTLSKKGESVAQVEAAPVAEKTTAAVKEDGTSYSEEYIDNVLSQIFEKLGARAFAARFRKIDPFFTKDNVMQEGPFDMTFEEKISYFLQDGELSRTVNGKENGTQEFIELAKKAGIELVPLKEATPVAEKTTEVKDAKPKVEPKSEPKVTKKDTKKPPKKKREVSTVDGIRNNIAALEKIAEKQQEGSDARIKTEAAIDEQKARLEAFVGKEKTKESEKKKTEDTEAEKKKAEEKKKKQEALAELVSERKQIEVEMGSVLSELTKTRAEKEKVMKGPLDAKKMAALTNKIKELEKQRSSIAARQLANQKATEGISFQLEEREASNEMMQTAQELMDEFETKESEDTPSKSLSGEEETQEGKTNPTVSTKETDTKSREYAEDYSLMDILRSPMAYTSAIVNRAIGFAQGVVKGPKKKVKDKKTGKVKTEQRVFYWGFSDEVAGQMSRLQKYIKRIKDDTRIPKKEREKRKAKAEAKLANLAARTYEDFVAYATENLLALYDTLTPEFIARAKDWYVGANRMANKIAETYKVSVEQAAGIIAVLSPQNDWFNNLSAAERVAEILTNKSDVVVNENMVADAIDYSGRNIPKNKKNNYGDALAQAYSIYGDISLNEMQKMGLSTEVQALYLRAIDHSMNSPVVNMTDPSGKFFRQDVVPVRWNSSSEIGTAIDIFRRGKDLNVINENLGYGNKVRNFYNNIVDPFSSAPYVTADTHALSAALSAPVSSKDADLFKLFSGQFEPSYAAIKQAYIDAAAIVGIQPREMQSILWEAQRVGINNKNRTESEIKKNFDLVQNHQQNNKSAYENATEIILENKSTDPEWGASAGIRTQKENSEIRKGFRSKADSRIRSVRSIRDDRAGRRGDADTRLGEESAERRTPRAARLKPKYSPYQAFLNLLNRAFPDVQVLATQEQFDKLVELAQAKKLVTKGQKVYGAVYGGKLYLNPAFENYNTPIHEFGHVWLHAAKDLAPEIYKKGIDLVKGTSYEQEVRDSFEYQRVIEQMRAEGATEAQIEQYILEEALATAIGDKGESFVMASKRNGFKNWLNKLYNFVRSMVKISEYSVEELQDLSFDEFLNGVAAELMSGEQLFPGTEVKLAEQEINFAMIGEKGASQFPQLTNFLQQAIAMEQEAERNLFDDVNDYLDATRPPLKNDTAFEHREKLRKYREVELDFGPHASEISKAKIQLARKIKAATGWEKGVDGKWRYEVDNLTKKLPFEVFLKFAETIDAFLKGESTKNPLQKLMGMPNQSFRLEDVKALIGPELISMYPDILKKVVFTVKKLGGKEKGSQTGAQVSRKGGIYYITFNEESKRTMGDIRDAYNTFFNGDTSGVADMINRFQGEVEELTRKVRTAKKLESELDLFATLDPNEKSSRDYEAELADTLLKLEKSKKFYQFIKSSSREERMEYLERGYNSGSNRGLTDSMNKIREFLIHETQHIIQDEEGFAQGGNPDTIKKRLNESFEYFRKQMGVGLNETLVFFNELMRERQKAFRLGKDPYKITVSNISQISPVAKNILEKAKDKFVFGLAIQQLEEAANRGEPITKTLLYRGMIDEFLNIEKGKSEFKKKFGESTTDEFILYENLAGEIEARVAVLRDKLTPAQRRNILIAETEFFDDESSPRANQQVLFEDTSGWGGPFASSAPIPQNSTIQSIVEMGRMKGIADSSIIELLKSRGFKSSEINDAMQLKDYLFEPLPAAFYSIKGGYKKALELYNDVRKQLDVFMKGSENKNDPRYLAKKDKLAKELRELKKKDGVTQEQIDAKKESNKKALEKMLKEMRPKPSQIRQKAREILEMHPIYLAQSEQVQMEIWPAFDKTLRTRANPQLQKEINNMRENLRQRQISKRNIRQLQKEMIRFIRAALPVSSSYNNKSIAKLLGVISDTNDPSKFLAEAEKVLDLVEKQEKKMKKASISDIVKEVNKKAGKLGKRESTTNYKRKRPNGLDAQGALFFEQAKKVLKAVLSSDQTKLQELTEKVDQNEGLLFEAMDKESKGETRTREEQEILDLAYSLSLFGGLNEMTLSELYDVLSSLRDISKQSSVRLKESRMRRKAFYDAQRQQANEQLQETNPEFFDKDGNLKSKSELIRRKKEIIRNFKKLKLGVALKQLSELYSLSDTKKKKMSLMKGMKHMETLCNRLDRVLIGKNLFRDNLYRKINQMIEVMHEFNRQSNDDLDSLASQAGFKDYRDVCGNLYGTIEIVSSINGKTFPFSKDNALRIYALSKNKTQREKLEAQGIGPKEIEAIKKKLGKNLVSFADNIVDYLTNSYYEKVNKVYMTVNDVPLSFIENYFPTMTEQSAKNAQDLISSSSDFSKNFDAQTSSALKERLDDNSEILLYGTDFTAALENHLKQQNKFRAYAEGVKQMNAFFKIPSVDRVLDFAGIREPLRVIINSEVNPEASDAQIQSSPYVNFFVNNYISVALGYKIWQIPKQASSFINAFAEYRYVKPNSGIPNIIARRIDTVMFAVDLAKMFLSLPMDIVGKGPIAEARRASATFNDRMIRGLSGDVFSLETNDMFKAMSKKDQELLLAKIQNMSAAARKAGGYFTAIGDTLGVMGYMVNYKRDLANGMSKDDAVEKFNNYNATQQSRRTTEKTLLQLSTNTYTRLITAFASVQFLYMNKVMSSGTNMFRALRMGKPPRTEDVRQFALCYGISNALFVLVSNLFKYSDGDEEDKEEVRNLVLEAMSGYSLLSEIPILNGVANQLNWAGKAIEKGEELLGLEPTKQKRKFFSSSAALDPLSSTLSQINKEIKAGKSPIGATIKNIGEIVTGVNTDPMIGTTNFVQENFKGDEINDSNFYEMIGVSSSYRPNEGSNSKAPSGKIDYNFRGKSKGKRGGRYNWDND